MTNKIKDKFTSIPSRQMRYVLRMRQRKLCTNDGTPLAKTSSWYCPSCLEKHRVREKERRDGLRLGISFRKSET